MARGFRWQFIAFVVSLGIFALVLYLRPTSVQSPPSITPPPTLSETSVSASTTSTVTDSLPSATPTPISPTEPVAAIPASLAPSDDGIPTYTEALVGSVNRLNPLFTDLNSVDRDISSLIFEGLTRINEYGEPVGNLARTWVISSDGLEYVLSLRDDVLWHDGTPFTSSDVLYTVARLQDSSYAGLAEVGAFWRTIEVDAINAYQLRFRLTQPLASFLSKLNFGILPEHALRGTDAQGLVNHRFNITPIGTGAYQLEALRSSDGIQVDVVDLRVSPNYRQRPEAAGKYAVERLRFRLYPSYDAALAALQRGEVDAYAARNWNERLPLVELAGFNVYTAIAPSIGMIVYNWDEPENIRFFQELRVRLALMTGLNRQTPVEAHLANRAVTANSPLLPNSWAYDSTLSYPVPDPFAAINLITSANINNSATDNSAEATAEATAESPAQTSEDLYAFSLLVLNEPALLAIANEVAAQWSQYRLQVTVETLDAEQLQQRLNDGQFQAAIVELPMGADPDIYAYWHAGQAPDGKNYGAVNDDRLSELLERGRHDTNGINRVQLYQQFQRRFIERGIAIPLYYPLYTYVVHEQLSGLSLGVITNPSERFRTLADWALTP